MKNGLTCVSSFCSERDSWGTMFVGRQTEHSWGCQQTMDGGQETNTRPRELRYEEIPTDAVHLHLTLASPKKISQEDGNREQHQRRWPNGFGRHAEVFWIQRGSQVHSHNDRLFFYFSVIYHRSNDKSIQRVWYPLKIFTGKGKEFFNKDVEAFLKELNIRQFYSNSPGKAVMAERLNRPLKERPWVH